MKRGIVIILLILGIGCLASQMISAWANVYLQIVGICLIMLALYSLSSKVPSKKNDDTNFQL